MSKTYQVWSQHVEPEPHDVLEVRRTSKDTAYDDARLIRDICHRRAWVVEL